MKFKLALHIILAQALLIGCAGYDRALLVTKTNVGIDIDSTPPTAEITIARRELAIQPIYPFSNGSEKALPLLAAFGLQGNFINPIITSYFAGGTAANLVVEEAGTVTQQNTVSSGHQPSPEDITKCLAKEPEDTRNWLLYLYHGIIGKSLDKYRAESKPFYFATDTSFGVKVAWSGTAGPYPDTLKLGYNRKEFAAPPVFIEKKCRTNPNFTWQARMPSFFAATDNTNAYDSFENASVKHIQFFATGSAANTFANRESVKRIAFENMAPDAAKLESQSLNKALFIEIKENYESGNMAKRNQIITKAKNLNLVINTVSTQTDFFSELEKAITKFSSASISNNLNILRVYSE